VEEGGWGEYCVVLEVCHYGWNNLTLSPKSWNMKFPGCMPVNFCRYNIEEAQRGDDVGGGYYFSEKTDVVRYLVVFTEYTVVLVDWTMTGKQITPQGYSKEDHMKSVLPLIKPGTVFDGELVMHRKLRRPLVIVSDVLCISSSEPILHLPFRKRLHHLHHVSFGTKTTYRGRSTGSDEYLAPSPEEFCTEDRVGWIVIQDDRRERCTDLSQ